MRLYRSSTSSISIAFLFLDFAEAVGSRGNFLGFVGNVGSIFNFSKKKLFGNKITVKFKFRLRKKIFIHVETLLRIRDYVYTI